MVAESAAELKTVRDWLAVTVERFNKAGLYFGHGSANARDEDKHHATQIVQNKTERHDEQPGKFNPVERRSGLFLAR